MNKQPIPKKLKTVTKKDSCFAELKALASFDRFWSYQKSSLLTNVSLVLLLIGSAAFVYVYIWSRMGQIKYHVIHYEIADELQFENLPKITSQLHFDEYEIKQHMACL